MTWKRIPGFSLYEVSTEGQVRSYNRGSHVRLPHSLARRRNRYGYATVHITTDGGECRNVTVHSLVLLAFVGPRPQDTEIRHFDGNPDNNRISNLVYGSRSANQRDSVEHGTHANAARTECPSGHPYDVANTYVAPGGGRHCRACNRAAVARYKARRAVLS